MNDIILTHMASISFAFRGRASLISRLGFGLYDLCDYEGLRAQPRDGGGV